MKTTFALKMAGMLLGGALAVLAQEGGWQASVNLAQPIGTAHDAAGLSVGASAGVAYVFATGAGYAFRPGLAMGCFSSRSTTGIRADADALIRHVNGLYPPSLYQVPGSSVTSRLTQMKVVGDFLIPLADSTALVFGLSLSRFSVNFSGGAAATYGADGSVQTPGIYSPVGLDAATYLPNGTGGLERHGDPNGSTRVPGLKLAVRLGCEFTLSKRLAGSLLFEQGEVGRMVTAPSVMPTMSLASLAAGVVYKF